MTEDQLEQETLGWLTDAGYLHRYGLDIAPDGSAPERSNYSQVLLVASLRDSINRLNPLVPPVAREDALQQVLNLDTPVLLAANRAIHQLLVNGVPVEYQKDGKKRFGDTALAMSKAFTRGYISGGGAGQAEYRHPRRCLPE